MTVLSIELIVSVVVAIISFIIYNTFFRVPGGNAHIVDNNNNNTQWKTSSDSNSQQNGKQVSGDSSGDSESDSDSSVANKLQLTILWGSQSGTAETFANDLADEAKSHGYKAKCYDVEKYDYKNKLNNEKCVIFLQATYGEGDPTDNAVEFFDYLKSDDLSESLYDKIHYSVFALGNRQYEHFCGAGLYLDNRMAELGGQRICDVGQGDDDGSLNDDFDEWKNNLWDSIKKELSSNEVNGTGSAGGDNNQSNDHKFVSHYKLKHIDNTNNYKSGIHNFKPNDTKHEAVLCNVVENRELRAGNKTDPDSSTRHVEFDLKNTGISYTTADNCYIWPKNSPTIAQRIAKRFNLTGKLEQCIEITTMNGKKPEKLGIPQKLTYNDLFSWYLDINNLSSNKHLKLIQGYIEQSNNMNDNDKQQHIKQLEYWYNNAEGKKQYHELKYSVLELLEKYNNIDIPLVDVIEFVPKLKARPYTISSSSVVQPDRLSITLSVSITKLNNNRRHEGTCTHYLRSLEPGKDKVWLYVTASTFRLPKAYPNEKKDKAIPVIMIGPGTGLAPFRAFIQEIEHIRHEQNLHIGPAILFYGCRNAKLDYIYENELNDASEKEILHHLFLAFSRDNADKQNSKKTYVQHLLLDNGKMIWQMLHDKNAYLYVCGGTSMGSAIRDAIVELGEKYGNMTHERAKEYLKELQDKKRYIAELWS